MQRNILKELVKWKDRSDHMPLLWRGYHSLESKSRDDGTLEIAADIYAGKNSPIGVKTSQDHFDYKSGILSLPLYMLAELLRLLDKV